MSTPDRVPLELKLSPVENNDRYVIHSRIEIVFILRAIMQKGTHVMVCLHRSDDFILTSILDIDAEHGKLIVECGADEKFNRRAMMAERLILVTSHDQVDVRFACHDIEKTRFEDRSAFSVSIPEYLLRMQRREYYRIGVPALDPPKCTIPLPIAHRAAELVPLDISCGGMAIVDEHSKIDFAPGAIYETCRLVLPEMGTLIVTLQVKNTFEATLKNGLTRIRAGCEYIAIPKHMLTVIQRYIFKLEREKRAKSAPVR